MAEYPYTDEEGRELYRVVRFKPKDFRVKRRVEGGWIWDKKEIREVLYRLPEVIKAEEIWLVEGEKDADNVRALGLTATTAPFGVGHWTKDFARHLTGKRVYVCLDKGAENESKKRAREILAVGAKEVKIIELPGLEKGGEDISDWLDMHDAQEPEVLRDMLLEIAEKTPNFELPSAEEISIKNEFAEQRDYGHALVLGRTFENRYRWAVNRNSWMEWNGLVWRPVPEERVAKTAADSLRQEYVVRLSKTEDKSEVEETLKRIRDSCIFSRITGALSFLKGWENIITMPK